MRPIAHTASSVDDRTLPDVGTPMSLTVVAVIGVLIVAIGLVALMATRR